MLKQISKLSLMLGYLLLTNPASANFDLMVGGKALYGTNSSEDGDFAPKSNSFNYGLETTLGYSYRRLLLGVGGEYLRIDQLDKIEDTGGVNLSGSRLNGSLIAGYSFGIIKVLGKYHVYSKLTSSEKSLNNEEVIYHDAQFPISLQIVWAQSSRTYLALEYTSIGYKSVEEGGSDRELSDDQQINMNSLGLVYGFFF